MEEDIKKERSPKYPRIALNEAVDLVRKLHVKAGRANIRAEVALGPLGYSSLNGAALGTLAALKHYGLVDSDRNGLSVSPLAIRLIHPLNDSQEAEAKKEAALRPKIFSQIFEGGYHDCSEDVLANHLVQIGFTPEGARRASAVYKSTVEFARIYAKGDGAETQPLHSSPAKTASITHVRPEPDSFDRTTSAALTTQPSHPEVSVPLTGQMVARIPYPMSEEDFELLIGTLNLWKRKLTTSD
ncbi:MAG: hypothetical protein ABR611_04465 [Chthoniobacterales bacterium]